MTDKTLFRSYASMSSAKRGAKTANIANPLFEENAETGKVDVFIPMDGTATQPKAKAPKKAKAEPKAKAPKKAKAKAEPKADRPIPVSQLPTDPSTVEKPVDMYRKIFRKHYGKKTWRELIAMAVEKGINPNTAKTYYYKLKLELEAEQAEADEMKEAA